MAARGESSARPGAASVIRMEVLHESERTRVARLVLRDGTLIRKEQLGPDGERRRRRELTILERLSGSFGVVEAASEQPGSGSILLKDDHGAPLSRVAKPLEGTQLTEFAVSLARAVAAVHRCGVIHRDINPGNVLVAAVDRHPVLID